MNNERTRPPKVIWGPGAKSCILKHSVLFFNVRALAGPPGPMLHSPPYSPGALNKEIAFLF